MGNVSGKPVNIIHQNCLEAALACVIAKLIQRRPGEKGATPSFVLIDGDNRPLLVMHKTLQFRDLRIDCLAFALLLGRHTAVQRNA